MNTERKFHIGAWILVIVGALLALHFHDAKVRSDERARVTADSLRQAGAQLDTATATAQAAVTAQRQREASLLGRIRGQGEAVRATTGRLDSLRAILVGIPDSLQKAESALEATYAQRETLLVAQRDSALSLFRGAAASRDTLAALLAASQAANHGLQQALVEAQRKPFLERGLVGTVVQGTRLVLEGRGFIAFLGR